MKKILINPSNDEQVGADLVHVAYDDLAMRTAPSHRLLYRTSSIYEFMF